MARYYIFGDEDWDLEMAGFIGKIDEFDSKCEEWKQYEQRLAGSTTSAQTA